MVVFADIAVVTSDMVSLMMAAVPWINVPSASVMPVSMPFSVENGAKSIPVVNAAPSKSNAVVEILGNIVVPTEIWWPSRFAKLSIFLNSAMMKVYKTSRFSNIILRDTKEQINWNLYSAKHLITSSPSELPSELLSRMVILEIA